MSEEVDTAWLLLCGFIVYFMQAGFALLECGAVRTTSAINTMVKNIGDSVTITMLWYLWGYNVAFGSGNALIGYPKEPIDSNGDFPFYFFHSTFACTAMTIVSGALLERVPLKTYFLLTTWMGIMIYPVIAHWMWSDDGWLKNRAQDFSGGSVVHVVGGTCGLMGTYYIGPREIFCTWKNEGRLEPPFQGHSIIHTGLGTLILWFGFYAFNAGSVLGLGDNKHHIAALITVNTSLAGAAGCIAAVLSACRGDVAHVKVIPMFNGALSGLVSITASCAYVQPWAAVIIGIIGGLSYRISTQLLWSCGIDDPIEAVSVHLIGGIWSMFAAGIFSEESGLIAGRFELLMWNSIATLAISAYCCVSYLIALKLIRRISKIRVSHKLERKGLDNELGMHAYGDIGEVLEYYEKERSLERLLQNKDEEVLWMFHAFVEKECSAEHLDFILAVDAYRIIENTFYSQKDRGDNNVEEKSRYTLEQELIHDFMEICDRYVRTGSPQEINIAMHVRERILQQLSKEYPQLGVFDLPRAECVKLLQFGPWVRFVNEIKSETSASQSTSTSSFDAKMRKLRSKAEAWLENAGKEDYVDTESTTEISFSGENRVLTASHGEIIWRSPVHQESRFSVSPNFQRIEIL